MEHYYVYIIQSKSNGRYYTGMTSNPVQRIEQHNLGLNTSTRNKGPWEEVWLSSPLSKKEGLLLERKIKKRGAKRYLENLL